MLTKILLIGGIVSSLLYVGTDIAAAMLYHGYSYVDQSISELGAIGAPSRPLWVAMSFLYNPLVIAFGIGVGRAADRKRSIHIAAILILLYGIFSFMGPFFPMHARGSETSFTDVMHIICTAGIVLSIVLFIGFGSGARGKWFRLYSILTILALLIFGALAGMQAPGMAAQLPTPWLGVMERVNVYFSMLWVLVFAVVLLRSHRTIP